MEIHRSLVGLIVLVACATCGQAQTPQTERAVLMRSQASAGGQTQATAVRLQAAIENGFQWRAGETDRAALPVGFLAAPTDREGYVTVGRIAQAIVGAAQHLEPLAIDFAGNRDGKVDVADCVAAALRLL